MYGTYNLLSLGWLHIKVGMGRAAKSIDGVEYLYWAVYAIAGTCPMEATGPSHALPVVLACTRENGEQALAKSARLASTAHRPHVLAQIALCTQLRLQVGRVPACATLGIADPEGGHAIRVRLGLTSRQWDQRSVHYARAGHTQQVQMLDVHACLFSHKRRRTMYEARETMI